MLLALGGAGRLSLLWASRDPSCRADTVGVTLETDTSTVTQSCNLGAKDLELCPVCSSELGYVLIANSVKNCLENFSRE